MIRSLKAISSTAPHLKSSTMECNICRSSSISQQSESFMANYITSSSLMTSDLVQMANEREIKIDILFCAYCGPYLPRVPSASRRLFRFKAATDSGAKFTSFSMQPCHPGRGPIAVIRKRAPRCSFLKATYSLFCTNTLVPQELNILRVDIVQGISLISL